MNRMGGRRQEYYSESGVRKNRWPLSVAVLQDSHLAAIETISVSQGGSPGPAQAAAAIHDPPPAKEPSADLWTIVYPAESGFDEERVMETAAPAFGQPLTMATGSGNRPGEHTTIRTAWILATVPRSRSEPFESAKRQEVDKRIAMRTRNHHRMPDRIPLGTGKRHG